jgi:hypothetical protein
MGSTVAHGLNRCPWARPLYCDQPALFTASTVTTRIGLFTIGRVSRKGPDCLIESVKVRSLSYTLTDYAIRPANLTRRPDSTSR